MVQASKSARKKAQMPIIVLTEREILSELGTECPQPIVDAIMASPKPKKKLREIKAALRRITRAAAREGWVEDPSVAGSESGYFGAIRIIKNRDVADLFARHTSSFVEIAEAGAYNALETLGDMEVWGLFDNNPAAFVKIAKAAGKHAGWAFNAIGNPAIGRLFAESPDTLVKSFAEIAKAAGENAGWAFEAIGDRDVSVLFAENPGILVGIAKAAGKGAGHAFDALGFEGVAEVFSSYPQGFLDIAKARGEKAYMSFFALRKPEAAGKFVEYGKGKITLEELLESIHSVP
jgi:hypothetical protein